MLAVPEFRGGDASSQRILRGLHAAAGRLEPGSGRRATLAIGRAQRAALKPVAAAARTNIPKRSGRTRKRIKVRSRTKAYTISRVFMEFDKGAKYIPGAGYTGQRFGAVMALEFGLKNRRYRARKTFEKSWRSHGHGAIRRFDQEFERIIREALRF